MFKTSSHPEQGVSYYSQFACATMDHYVFTFNGPVAIVPASSHLLRDAGVVYRPWQEPTPTFDLALAWLAGNASPVLQKIVQVAREATKEWNGAIMDASSLVVTLN